MHKSKVMRKLLGQPSATANESIDTSISDSPQLRPSASQHTTYSGGVPIACLDGSPDGQRAIIAGSKVFKVLKVDGPTITEDIDLRTTVTSYASTHDPSAATPEQLNIRAVKWAHGVLDTSIIAACGNGRITVYDLNRAGNGLEVGRIHEHARQVHKLAINPFKPNWLLSASQDGTVKSFDIRAPSSGRNGPIFSVWKTFKGNADAVRDVKWSPTDGMEFACATDAGVVLKWDARKAAAPVIRLPAHTSACFSISWHSDGDHLMSGGMDQYCHVWDLSKKAERNQKPRYSIATAAPISTVSWRPAFWSATAQGRRAAQVAVSYDDSNVTRNQTSTVHIWDLARPTMPFKELEQWDSSPTGILWRSRDLFWSVDREGRFTQTDIAFVPQAVDRRSLSTFEFSPQGDVLMLLEERHQARRSRPSISSPEVSPSYQRDSNAPILSISQSDSEDDVVGSFLGPRLLKAHRRSHSGRTNQLSMTPANSTGMAESSVMSLDEAVNITGIYKPRQVVAIGHAPSSTKRAVIQYYTNRYLLPMRLQGTTLLSMNISVTSVMEQHAKTAENIGHFRLAQTWRLLAYTMNILLIRRAEYHRQERLNQGKATANDLRGKKESVDTTARSQRDIPTPSKQLRVRTPVESSTEQLTKSITVEESESTSNVATPLARPVLDTISQQTREAMHTSLVVEDDPLDLREAENSASPTPIPVPGATPSPETAHSSVEGYDFYGMEVFSPAMAIAAPPRKPPLRLDYSTQRPPERIQPQRHDSGESFQMFSSSGDSTNKFMSSSGSEGHSLQQDNGNSLRERMSNWESSFPSSSATQGSEGERHYDDLRENLTPNSNGISHQDGSKPPPFLRLQEASAPPVLDHIPSKEPTSKSEGTELTPKKMDQNPEIIESDFEPWLGDPGFTIPALDPAILVQRTINFEAQTSSLHAAIMVLLLRRLLPRDALDGIQSQSILRTYQQRLLEMKLFAEAALLRNLCVPAYPPIFSNAQQNVTVGYFCTDCYKPIENDPLIPGSMWRCPRCQGIVDACAVCKSRHPQEDIGSIELNFTEPGLGLWFLCPGCGHGGHMQCMQAWHSGAEFAEGTMHSGGCCPLEGCLHPCLPGTWRLKRAEERSAAKSKVLEGLVKESSRGSVGMGTGRATGVRRDPREVNQSKAVEGVRMALAGGVDVSGVGAPRKKNIKAAAAGEARRSIQ